MRVVTASLVCAFGCLGGQAGASQWVAARSAHFAVVSDASEKQARQVARQFEALRDVFQSVVNARVDPARPLIVFAVRNEDGLRELLPGRFKARGRARPAGIFYQGGDVHYIALRLDVQGPHPYYVVYHEYVHLLNGLNFRRLPLWLNEGLAEFYATTDVDAAEVRVGQIFPWHVQLLKERPLLPVEKLFAVDWSSPEYNEASRVTIFYAQSAALTHFFLMGGGGAHRKALGDYLTLLGRGEPEAEAQRKALGDLGKLDRDFSSYVHQWMFQGAKAPLRQDQGEVTVRPLGDAESLALRAEFLARTGSRVEARALLDQALRSDPELAPAHRVLGSLHAADGRKRDALAEYERATTLAPGDFLGHYRLGITSIDADGDAARRERSLLRAIELQPAYAPAHSALGGLLQNRKERSAQAVEHLRKAVGLEPNEEGHSLRLLGALRTAGQAGEADQIEAGLLQAARSDAGVLQAVSAFYEDAGRTADAEALLLKARTAQPGHAGVLRLLADYFYDQERYDEAEPVYRQALALQPDNPTLLNDLGYMNAERNVKVVEALQLIEKALKKRPDDGNLLDSRGLALFRLSRNAEAERDLRRALELVPGPIVLDHLGDVLAARGARFEAVDCWRRALTQDDLDPERRAALEAKIGSAQSESSSPPAVP